MHRAMKRGKAVFVSRIQSIIASTLHSQLLTKMTGVFIDKSRPSMMSLSYSRGQMVREASLTEADLAEVAQCRRDHNRLGFAYQIGFVRLFSRFPDQQPLEVCDELLSFVAMQLNIDATSLDEYAARQPTVSDHQERIRD